MKKIILAALSASFLAPAFARASCSISVSVHTNIDRLSLDQQVGAERLDCRRSPGRGFQVHVIRRVKTSASASASTRASASGSASGSTWGSCTASCSNGGSGSCSAYGSYHDYCSDSGSASDGASAQEESVFTVAWAEAAAIEAKGYAVSGEGEKCELQDKDGAALDALKAIALVTWVYGEALMTENGADLKIYDKLSKKPSKKDASK